MPKIVLHQWAMSPFCNKVRRCLTWKGLSFEVIDYNGLRAREAAKLSRVGTLPVLDYDGERIVDSSAIALRLERLHPTPALFPADPAERARSHFWENWAEQSLYFFEIYFRMLDPVAREKALDLLCAGRPGYERALVRIVLAQRYPKKLRAQGLGRLERGDVERIFFEHVSALDALLAKEPWLAGSNPSIADISVVAQLDEVIRTSELGPKIRAHAAVASFLDRAPGRAEGQP